MNSVSFSYSGKTALVTGAARRLGCETSFRLAEAGCKVLAHYYSSEVEAQNLKNKAEERGLKLELYRADLSREAGILDLFREISSKNSRLDILINCAAVYSPNSLEQASEESLNKTYALNLFTPLLCVKAAMPLFANSPDPCAINVADIAGINAWKNHSVYAPSKAALIHLTRCLALELAPKIRVNAIAPGTILPAESLGEEELARLKDKIPLNRFGTIEEFFHTLEFIITNRFVTGQIIAIDGGRSLL